MREALSGVWDSEATTGKLRAFCRTCGSPLHVTDKRKNPQRAVYLPSKAPCPSPHLCPCMNPDPQ